MILDRLDSIALYSIETLEERNMPLKYKSQRKESFIGFSASTNIVRKKIKNIEMKKLKPN